MNKDILIFSDGSSRGNPGLGGWGAIVADCDKVVELGGAEKHTTNNRMELTAAIKGLQQVKNIKSNITVHTDSAYVVNGITKWVYGWQKKNWKTSEKEDVINRDLWEELIKATGERKIKWVQISGHVGVPGNERCDEIATSFADGKLIELFDGKLSDYEHDLTDIKGCGIKAKKKGTNKAPAYSYLSLVHGVLHIDKTWAECEKRVKGVKGDVKFKKSTSAENEKEILKEWGN